MFGMSVWKVWNTSAPGVAQKEDGKMPIYVDYQIECDGCGQPAGDGQPTMDGAMTEARERGFEQRRLAKQLWWLCAECKDAPGILFALRRMDAQLAAEQQRMDEFRREMFGE